MRKRLLVVALVAASLSTSYAQNSASLTQNGNGQSATQNQAGANQLSTILQVQGTGINMGNSARTYQAGTSLNTATIRQINSAADNRADIWQGYASSNSVGVSLNNVSTIEQSGDGTATGLSSGNDATIYQLGENNFASVLQSVGATNSSVTIDQRTIGTDNEAVVLQGKATGQLVAAGPYTNNDVTITQRGSTNKAYMQQVGSGNTVNIEQTGTQNQVRGLAGSPYGMESYAKQIGDNNTLTIIQTNAPGTGGYIQNIEQVGSGNVNVIIQTNN